MSVEVTVVDYGIGNLFSVQRALEVCGATVKLTSDPDEVAAATRLILPGVGAFADGMQGLRERGLTDVIRRYADEGKPLLGICLGMQMLLSYSEEFGEHEGLGIIAGRVVAIPSQGLDGTPHKIPHVGWSELYRPASCTSWNGTVFDTTDEGSAVYLVHSFAARPDDDAHRLADFHYDGLVLSAAIRSGLVFGCQFHPEKSGAVGLRILESFLRLPGVVEP